MSLTEINAARDRYNCHRDVERQFRDSTEQPRWARRGSKVFVRTSVEKSDIPAIGDVVHFSIEALAIRKIGARPGRKARRRYLTDKTEREEWALDRLAKNGLSVRRIDSMLIDGIVARKDDVFNKPGARYWGVAEVTDEVAITHALTNGIGDGKAFGFGMLIINKEDQ